MIKLIDSRASTITKSRPSRTKYRPSRTKSRRIELNLVPRELNLVPLKSLLFMNDAIVQESLKA